MIPTRRDVATVTVANDWNTLMETVPRARRSARRRFALVGLHAHSDCAPAQSSSRRLSSHALFVGGFYDFNPEQLFNHFVRFGDLESIHLKVCLLRRFLCPL